MSEKEKEIAILFNNVPEDIKSLVERILELSQPLSELRDLPLDNKQEAS